VAIFQKKFPTDPITLIRAPIVDQNDLKEQFAKLIE
jgi:hypothetical protein